MRYDKKLNEAQGCIAQGDTLGLITILKPDPELINYQDTYGQTLIFHAIEHYQPQIFCLLLNRSANLGIENFAGWDPVSGKSFVEELETFSLLPNSMNVLVSNKDRFLLF